LRAMVRPNQSEAMEISSADMISAEDR